MQNYFIINNDCISELKLFGDESIDLVVTDPPYLINYVGQTEKFSKPIANDNNPDVIKDFIPEIYRILKPNTAFYCFCSPDTIETFKTLIQQYFTIKNLVIWEKNNWTTGDCFAQYGKSYEIIIYANKGRRPFNGKRLPDVWHFDRIVGPKQVHQNQKPVALLSQIIEKSSNPNDIVLDPFMGSGSTLVAATSLGRKAIGIELEGRYCEIAKKRLQQTSFADIATVDFSKPIEGTQQELMQVA